MSDSYWVTDAQMARLERYFPKSHGKPRVVRELDTVIARRGQPAMIVSDNGTEFT